jgi:hypothetical protein
VFQERTKHIDVKYHFIRDVIAEGDIKVCKIGTCDNPADISTKPRVLVTFGVSDYFLLK